MLVGNYIGGDFHSGVSETFSNSGNTTCELYFPERTEHSVRSFFETATDSLAAIVMEIAATTKVRMNLWHPSHYCMETIVRLNLKVGNRIELRTQNYKTTEEIVAQSEGINVVLFNHFNRFNAEIGPSLKQMESKGFICVEDFVHAPLEIKRFSGKYSFNSLRKISDIEVSVAYGLQKKQEAAVSPSEYYEVKKSAADCKRDFFLNLESKLEEKYLQLFKEAEEQLNRKEIVNVYSKELERFFHIDWDGIHAKRKQNYDVLYGLLKPQQDLKLLDGEYMYLIIRSEKRNELRNFLFSKKIFPVIHWPDSLDVIKETSISFHIDQRYNAQDMQRTAENINLFYSPQ